MINQREAVRHLDLLGGSDRHVFQVKPELPGYEGERRPQHFYGTYADLSPQLMQLQDDGCAVFVQVQGGISARIRDVHRARCFFLDFDEGRLPELPKPPTLVLRTPRGWHVYYAIMPTSQLDDWKSMQKALTCELGADPKCGALNQKARLAGFEHQKQGFPVRIRIAEHRDTIYTLDDFESYLEVAPVVEDAPIEEYTAHFGTWEFPLLRYWLRHLLSRLRAAEKGNRFSTLQDVATQMGSYAVVGLDADIGISNMRKIVRTWPGYDHNDGFNTINACFNIGYARGLTDPPHAPPRQVRIFEMRERRTSYLDSVGASLSAVRCERGRITVEEVMATRPDWRDAFESDRSARLAIAERLRELGLVERRVRSQRFFEFVPLSFCASDGGGGREGTYPHPPSLAGASPDLAP